MKDRKSFVTIWIEVYIEFKWVKRGNGRGEVRYGGVENGQHDIFEGFTRETKVS